MAEKELHNEEAKGSGETGSPKNRMNPLPWIAGAVLLLGLAVIGGIYWSSTMTVKEVRFRGNHLVSLNDLKKVKVPMGLSPDSMNFRDIMHRYEQIPYVKRANISVEPSGNLLVTISERHPLAMLVDGDHKIYVDRDGIRLPLRFGGGIDVPILYGFSAKPMSDTLDSDGFEAAADFLINVRRRPVSNATISEVAWTKDEGIVALTNQNGVKLIFGYGGYAKRLRDWEAFYGQVIKQKGIEKMKTIDLRFEGQIVTREK
ncbi:MAG: cell division protein FtsQ/DivIB [Balneolaceae bacterium]|jgi:cell division septal protein FtsQ